MILLIMTVIAGCLVVSHSRANIDTLIREPFSIRAAASGEAYWTLHHSFRQTQLEYNRNIIQAYYNNPERLAGFSKTLSATDLPENITRKINKKFLQCDIVNVMLFIDAKGRIFYYAGVVQSKKLIALKISSRCRLNVLQKISLD